MIDLAVALAGHPGAVSFTYGDSLALNAEILSLVRSGRKTMTCEAWDAFAARGEPLPMAGRVDIALDWAGLPAFAVKTVSVEKVRFCDVQEDYVPPQGEFRDLEHWRAGYKAYLSRAGHFHPEMDIVIETFEMVEDFA